MARCDFSCRDEKRCEKSLKNRASSNPDQSLYMKRNATVTQRITKGGLHTDMAVNVI